MVGIPAVVRRVPKPGWRARSPSGAGSCPIGQSPHFARFVWSMQITTAAGVAMLTGRSGRVPRAR